MAQFPSDAYPRLAEFTFEHILRPGYSFAVEFEFGLDLLLDGLDQAHKACTAGPGGSWVVLSREGCRRSQAPTPITQMRRPRVVPQSAVLRP